MSASLPLDCDWQSQMKTMDAFWHMQKNQVACDIVFEIGLHREKVGAHSFVLMSRSTRFFHEYLTAAAKKFIPIREVSSISFREFLRYLYTDTLDYTNWRECLYLGNKYEVKPLIEKIFEGKVCKVTADEFCGMVGRFEHLEGYLEYRCLKHVFDNQKLIFECDSFYHLPYEFVLKLVSSDHLVIDENLIYNALFLWAEKACFEKSLEGSGAKKRQVLGDIIYHIRFTLLPREFFSDHVSEQGLLEDSEEVKILKRYMNPNKPVPNDFKFKTEPRKAPETEFGYIPLKYERWRPVFEGSEDEASASLEFRSDDSRDVGGAAGGDASVSAGASCMDGLPSVRSTISLTSHNNYQDELESNLFRLQRFSEREAHSGWGYKNETVDAIAVVPSRDIAIASILVFGIEPGKKMTGTIKILADNAEGSEDKFSFTCYKERKIYEVYLHKTVKLNAKQEYHILVDVEGGLSGFYGKGGKSQVQLAEGLCIHIKQSKYSTNHTDANMGQIMGMMFRVFKPLQ